jgi:hypothetical protein
MVPMYDSPLAVESNLTYNLIVGQKDLVVKIRVMICIVCKANFNIQIRNKAHRRDV